MFFCTGVDHARHIRDLLISNGVSAVAVTGDMPKTEREQAIRDFKSGKIRAITNVNCLSTGFEHSGIDLLVLARPTLSQGLYLQQVGRGMRISPDKQDCLVLDFAGVVETHGPITNVKPPKKGGEGNGEAPIKVCDNCHELVHISAQECPACGAPFPEREKPELKLRDVDIMGVKGTSMKVRDWDWQRAISKQNGKEMICITYYGGLSDKPVKEWLLLNHDGWAGIKARQLLAILTSKSGVSMPMNPDIDELCFLMNNATPPSEVEYKIDGKYFRVIDRIW